MRNSFSFAVCNAKAQGEEDKPIAPAQGHSPCQPSEDSEDALFHGSQLAPNNCLRGLRLLL